MFKTSIQYILKSNGKNHCNNKFINQQHQHQSFIFQQQQQQQGCRTFFNINNINSSVDMNVIRTPPQSVGDVYQYMRELASFSAFSSESIRIPFLSSERDLNDIKGIKLYGLREERSWVVIVGGREPDQWGSISLALYLGALFTSNPLENIDVLLFPIQNPSAYNHCVTPQNLDDDQNHPTTLLVQQPYQHDTHHRSNNSSSSGHHISRDSINSTNGTTNMIQLNNSENNSNEYYSERKSSIVFNDWLKRTKRKFTPLELKVGQNGKPFILDNNHAKHNSNQTDIEQTPQWAESNKPIGHSQLQKHLNPTETLNHTHPSYILEIPNIKISDDNILQYSKSLMSEIRQITFPISHQ